MSKRKLAQLGMVAGAPLVLLAAASAGQAMVVDSFDNSSSFTTGNANRTYNPPPIWVGLDNGTPTVTATNTVTWSANNSPNTNLGSPSSGSLNLAWTFNTAADGNGNAAFTMDILPTAQVFTSISFDMMIDPSSTYDQYGNQYYPEYGYFTVNPRDNNYDYDSSTGGANGGLGVTYGTDPVTGAAESSFPAGVWEHFTQVLIGANRNVRAITFADYSNGANGPESIYIDNVTLTPVPEPASFGLMVLGGSSMLLRRRRKV